MGTTATANRVAKAARILELLDAAAGEKLTAADIDALSENTWRLATMLDATKQATQIRDLSADTRAAVISLAKVRTAAPVDVFAGLPS